MKMIFALSVAFVALSVGTASAEWTQPARVRFEQGDNYTPWADANVTFATGAEMNRGTASFNYNALGGRYAIVRTPGGQEVVVRLSGFAYCVGDFNQTCLPGGKADGFDEQTRHWQICTTPSC